MKVIKTLFIVAILANLNHMLAQKPFIIKFTADEDKYVEYVKEKRDRIYEVTEATLTIYPAKHCNGKAIIACPGGGYTRLAIAHEGHEMASWFNKMGITYAVLTYRMPNGNYKIPVEDAQRAMRIFRKNANKWNINKIGIMGFSAGGHLASTVATHYNTETRPDFQILFYPVITMDKSYTHMGSHNNLLGKDVSAEMENKFSNEKQITADTPQAFIMHCTDDKAVPVTNSINYYLSLLKNGVSASLHIYPTGGHGWGNHDNFTYKKQWQNELKKWLETIE